MHSQNTFCPIPLPWWCGTFCNSLLSQIRGPSYYVSKWPPVQVGPDKWCALLRIAFWRLFYLNNIIPQLLATTCQKSGFIWEGFVVTTSNIIFNSRPILQPSVIALRVVSQPLKWKIIKMVPHVSLRLKSYLETNRWKSFLFFANDK